jgi:hypothetical protein
MANLSGYDVESKMTSLGSQRLSQQADPMSRTPPEELPAGKIETVKLEDIKPREHGIQDFTKKEEDAVIRKLDWHIMPLIFILYSLSVLDRSNLGNARIAGLTKDIDLSGRRYDWLATAFYIACEFHPGVGY